MWGGRINETSVCSWMVELGVTRHWGCSMVSGRLYGELLLASRSSVPRPQTRATQLPAEQGSRRNWDGANRPLTQTHRGASHGLLASTVSVRAVTLPTAPGPVAQHMAPLNGFWHQRGIYFLDKAAKIILHLCSRAQCSWSRHFLMGPEKSYSKWIRGGCRLWNSFQAGHSAVWKANGGENGCGRAYKIKSAGGIP